ncbi:hypothetical protein F4827_002511 [Paraburkholderia bannensis]|uniref:Preprotein translocase subunit SecA n=1 Tax=Paraburkholderia bannensis TaxID=765414 RepID=A0A7W9WSM6_9BURK|nr:MULTISPECIES: hypothetical protein [Paraburkholderia]MBB3257646.1 hypothetical protein [Paraburkholderia sp. WP4_3_2]MBB6102659.1 hypothetical protein [Paraburkholderia bannensis]
MLSHHELAALLLIRDANAPLQTLDADFMALARYQLVEMDDDNSGRAARLTTRGQELLRRLTHDHPYGRSGQGAN